MNRLENKQDLSASYLFKNDSSCIFFTNLQSDLDENNDYMLWFLVFIFMWCNHDIMCIACSLMVKHSSCSRACVLVSFHKCTRIAATQWVPGLETPPHTHTNTNSHTHKQSSSKTTCFYYCVNKGKRNERENERSLGHWFHSALCYLHTWGSTACSHSTQLIWRCSVKPAGVHQIKEQWIALPVTPIIGKL